MEKIEKYPSILAQYVEELANERNAESGGQLEYQALADTAHGHFQLIRLGWNERRYNYLVLLHLDLKADGKIWVQQNNTEIRIDQELAARGIQKSNLVLGFRPAYLREMAEAA